MLFLKCVECSKLDIVICEPMFIEVYRGFVNQQKIQHMSRLLKIKLAKMGISMALLNRGNAN